jgi:hypothetical protein
MKVTFTFNSQEFGPAVGARRSSWSKLTGFRLPRAVALGVALIGAVSYGCAAGTGVPVLASDQKWASERWPGTTLSDLSRGHDVFVSRCSSCHSLPRPELKSPDEWTGVLDEMAARAKLSSMDRDFVNRYLSAASQRLRSRSAVTRAEPDHPAL